jgi:hypothetical protein
MLLGNFAAGAMLATPGELAIATLAGNVVLYVIQLAEDAINKAPARLWVVNIDELIGNDH